MAGTAIDGLSLRATGAEGSSKKCLTKTTAEDGTNAAGADTATGEYVPPKDAVQYEVGNDSIEGGCGSCLLVLAILVITIAVCWYMVHGAYVYQMSK